jgi:tRNA threonylcarbamoyladenosine modification (KEOPS) complex Cgi121 subunit
LPREGSFSCLCWEINTKPEELDALLARTRGRHPGVVVQIFRAARAPNPSAMLMIAAQTLTAAKSGATLAEKPELDLLLRLAGTRQIGEAFRRVGYRSSGKKMFMVAASEGKGARLRRLGDELAKVKGFKEVPKRALATGDLEYVEVAALLSVRL